MQIKTAEFVMSNTRVDLCPEPTKPEYAFIGRSNVGKSSLINMLTDHKNLAKTSGKPGKTQLINHFIVNEEWYLVDLPGYGYAKASKKSREQWSSFITRYMLERENLLYVFLLIDCRIPAQKIDLEFMEFLGTKGVPFIIVFTKIKTFFVFAYMFIHFSASILFTKLTQSILFGHPLIHLPQPVHINIPSNFFEK